MHVSIYDHIRIHRLRTADGTCGSFFCDSLPLHKLLQGSHKAMRLITLALQDTDLKCRMPSVMIHDAGSHP